MSRELIVEIIALKRTLYQTEHELHLRELAIEEEFQLAGEEQPFEKERKLLAIETEQFQVQLKLNRAHLFGLRLAKGATPHCSACFIEHGTTPEMVCIEPRILGTTIFKCSVCGHELKTEP